jgi:hypothetical protein
VHTLVLTVLQLGYPQLSGQSLQGRHAAAPVKGELPLSRKRGWTPEAMQLQQGQPHLSPFAQTDRQLRGLVQAAAKHKVRARRCM